MSSTGANIDNPLELIQKTYNLQTTATATTNNHENISQSRSSIAKVSTRQPSRRTSVHDIHEVTRDDLNKIVADIQGNLSRLKFLLETIVSAPSCREEFFKLKDQLFTRISEFISKLSTESTRRGSITSKTNSSSLISYHPQHLVYCIEYFRSELVKSKYLFSSLTSSSSIGTATLNSTQVKPVINDFIIDQPTEDNQDMQATPDLIQIKKDISTLEGYAHDLTQRYYSQIPDWHTLDGTSNEAANKTEGMTINRLRLIPLNPKLSTTSSLASFDDSNICSRIYQKCQNICCLCTPHYI
ncbi:unnamed protein product [Adineta steineri]|uniref:Uncharacterized protein n=1 Tax=Adineta steineri TaxID=433720 RepID=A0A814DKX0_9BILA|nr:unnamed protein product [Adineta steineri]CAF0956207.1 unnamed protein product [Adineta steineri]CAF0961220.1 unnamed protein product [Adineta steineri]